MLVILFAGYSVRASPFPRLGGLRFVRRTAAAEEFQRREHHPPFGGHAALEGNSFDSSELWTQLRLERED